MARLTIKTQGVAPGEIRLAPGCNRLGREGENDFLVAHPSVSGHHCEVWVTNEALLVRDLGSSNGTYVDDSPVQEAQVLDGQTLRLGDVELVVAEAPAIISVPDLPLPAAALPTFMPDGSPCCFRHATARTKKSSPVWSWCLGRSILWWG